MQCSTVDLMANTPVFTLRLPTGIKGALAEIAREDRRSVGNLISKVMEDYIGANGFMLCPDCMGSSVSGTDEDGEPDLCDTCNGLGYVRRK